MRNTAYVNVPDITEAEVIKFANTVPLFEIAKMVQ
jgi:hypothetical protein